MEVHMGTCPQDHGSVQMFSSSKQKQGSRIVGCLLFEPCSIQMYPANQPVAALTVRPMVLKAIVCTSAPNLANPLQHLSPLLIAHADIRELACRCAGCTYCSSFDFYWPVVSLTLDPNKLETEFH